MLNRLAFYRSNNNRKKIDDIDGLDESTSSIFIFLLLLQYVIYYYILFNTLNAKLQCLTYSFTFLGKTLSVDLKTTRDGCQSDNNGHTYFPSGICFYLCFTTYVFHDPLQLFQYKFFLWQHTDKQEDRYEEQQSLFHCTGF